MSDPQSAPLRPPFWSRFGVRLTIAILAIVAVVTLGLLALVQARFNAAYGAFLEERFNDEIRAFEQQSEARRDEIGRAIEDITLAVRPRAALEAGDPARAYSDLSYELEPLAAEEPIFFRIFSIEGELHPPAENNAGTVAGITEETIAATLAPYLPASRESERLGYLSFPTPGEPTLYEVFMERVNTVQLEEPLGWLVVGRVLDREALGAPSESIESGVFADGNLFSPSIPAAEAANIEGQLESGASGARPRLQLDGVNYLLFTSRMAVSAGMPEAWRVQLYSLAGLEALVGRIQQLAIWFLLAALLLGLALSYFVSQSFARRIEKLVTAMREIGRGKFDVETPGGSDELGLLSESTKQMAGELALKEKMRDVLNLVTDPSVAQEMLDGKIELGGEAREVATLFCDIRGFTPLTDGMDPREVVDLVNEHMTEMTRLAYAHQGVVDKYVGDEIMVLFGAPHPYGDDWVNAVRCGLAMVDSRNRLNEQSERPIRIGVGIAAGEVVAGQMGSDERRNYTVLGDRVNLASRLCSKAGPGEVIIDEAICQRLPSTAQFERIDSVQLKGFKNPIPVFRVISVDGSPAHSRPVP